MILMKQKKLLKSWACLLGLGVLLSAQAQVLDERLSGFEKNGEAWTVDSTDFIAITNEKAAAGSYAMVYNMNETYQGNKPWYTIDTRHTIMHVRTAMAGDKKVIIAATYEGAILSVSFEGAVL